MPIKTSSILILLFGKKGLRHIGLLHKHKLCRPISDCLSQAADTLAHLSTSYGGRFTVHSSAYFKESDYFEDEKEKYSSVRFLFAL